MKGYKISVIMPSYNRADYIKDSIDSVLSQTYDDYEIIVSDDGSTDDTEKVIGEYMTNHQNIIYIKSEHSGVCKARNLAIDRSTGDWLFFLDTDDCIHSMLFEKMISAVKTTGAVMASQKFYRVNSEKMKKILSDSAVDDAGVQYVYRNKEETVNDIFQDSPLSMIGGLLVKREIAENIKFDDRFIIGEDKLYCYQCVLQDSDYVYIPQKWYYNRIHEHNSSWNYSRTAFLSRYMRRKIFWKTETGLGRNQNALREMMEAIGIILNHFKQNKSLKEAAFLSRIIRNDRKDLLCLKNKKAKILVFVASYLNPLLLFERNAPELDVWKETGLY